MNDSINLAFGAVFLLLERAVKWTNSKETIVVPLLNFQVMPDFRPFDETARVCVHPIHRVCA